MAATKQAKLIGYASGLAASSNTTENGPLVLQQSSLLGKLSEKGIDLDWLDIIKPEIHSAKNKLAAISELCHKLAQKIAVTVRDHEFFIVFGGDHSSAIGTWSGAAHALKEEGPLGLIWIDAHMDSHTPHTSLSGNIHGMPLACLLGYGFPSLTQILDNRVKLKPEHVCLIGVRSFERGEAALLKELNVKIYFIDEVKQRGLAEVMKEAVSLVSRGTKGFGVSLDIDSLDPNEAPGTGVPEPNGLSTKELLKSLNLIAKSPGLLGLEIVEFDPLKDQNQKTEKIIANIIETVILGNFSDEVYKDTSCNSTNVGL